MILEIGKYGVRCAYNLSYSDYSGFIVVRFEIGGC